MPGSARLRARRSSRARRAHPQGQAFRVRAPAGVTGPGTAGGRPGNGGIGFVRENQRRYPNRELASHLLGYVGVDNVGLGGIEGTYDSLIRGKAGTILVQTDARRHAFSRVERPPTAGASLELTIDQYLQYVAERELRAGVNRAAPQRDRP